MKNLFGMFILGLLFLPLTAQAGAVITYHGRIVDSAGTPVVAANVTFRIQVLSPNPGKCLLYEETRTISMVGSDGVFVIPIGDGAGSRTSQDPGIVIEKIFTNNPDITFNTTNYPKFACNSGTSYTPDALHQRQLFVAFDDHSGAGEQILPLMDVNFVPFSVTAYDAQNVGGTPANSVMRLSSGTATPLTPANFTELMNLISGSSTQYIQSGAESDPTVKAFAKTDLPACTAGQVLKASGGVLSCVTASGSSSVATTSTTGVVQVGSGLAVTGAGILSTDNAAIKSSLSLGISDVTGLQTALDGKVLYSQMPTCTADEVWTFVSAAAGFVCTPISITSTKVSNFDTAVDARIAVDTTKLPLAGGTMSGAINMNGQNLTLSGFITMNPSKTLHLSNNASDPVGLVAADKGKVWFNSTSNSVKYWDGSAAQTLGVSGAGLQSLNGDSTTSQTFATGTAGTDFAISTSGGVHTFNLPTASSSARGLLTSADWSTFNGKQAAGNYITTLSGDVSSSAYTAGTVTTSVDKIKGIPVSATPTLSGQVLRYSGGNFLPGFISMLDLRSNVSGSQALASSCAANQTLTYNSVGDNLTCAAIAITSSQVSGLGALATKASVDLSTTDVTGTLPIARGGTGAVTATDALNALLPAQASQSGKVLQTDGTNATWVTAAATGVTSITSANSYLTVGGTASVPTLTTNVGTTANTLAAGNDSRITGALQTSGGTMTGMLTLATGTTTLAPLVIPTGTLLTTPVAGGIESDGTSLYWSNSSASRQKLLSYTGSVPNGTIFIGNGSGFIKSSITAGSGISVTNGAGSITISTTGGGTVTSVTSANTDINVDTGTTTPVLTLNSGTTGGATDANKIAKLDASGWLTTTMIPSLAATKITSGIFPIARGGTNSGTALNNNRVMISSGGAIVETNAITADRALASDTNGLPIASSVTGTELSYLSGVTSAIQTQLNAKTASSGWTNYSVMAVNGSGALNAVPGTVNGSILNYTATGPAWTTATFPTTTTANQLLFSSANNVVGGLATSNNAYLTTNASGVPSWSSFSAGDLFTQYVLSNGRSGGQTIYGGTASGNNLTLSSTSNTTKGYILLSGGNVGVGTSTPAAALDVSGTVNATAVTAPTVTGGTVTATGGLQGAYMAINGSYAAAVNASIQNSSTTGYSGEKYLDAAGTWQGTVGYSNTGAGVVPGSVLLASMTTTPVVLATNLTERVRVLATGEVGIGTSTPTRLLQVAGPMKITPSALPGTPTAGDIAIDSGSSNALKFYNGTAWQTASGASSLDDLSDAIYSSGYQALFIGNNTGTNSTGLYNTGVGVGTMSSNTSGYQNAAFGGLALAANTTGSTNVAVGGYSMNANTTGYNNAALGEQSLYNTQTGAWNTAVGRQALYGVSGNSISANTAVGYRAGYAVTTGGYNTFLGYTAGSTVTSGTSNIVIGAGAAPASVTGSNQLSIGNVIYGDLSAKKIGIGNSAPAYALDVTGDIHATATIIANATVYTSDIRFKKDIQVLDQSLAKILNIRGVSYNWRVDEFPNRQFNDRHQVGVIAQEVEKEYPEAVYTAADGYKAVNYAALVSPVIEAIKEFYGKWTTDSKELHRKIASLESENEILKVKVQEVDGMKKALCKKDSSLEFCH